MLHPPKIPSLPQQGMPIRWLCPPQFHPAAERFTTFVIMVPPAMARPWTATPSTRPLTRRKPTAAAPFISQPVTTFVFRSISRPTSPCILTRVRGLLRQNHRQRSWPCNPAVVGAEAVEEAGVALRARAALAGVEDAEARRPLRFAVQKLPLRQP